MLSCIRHVPSSPVEVRRGEKYWNRSLKRTVWWCCRCVVAVRRRYGDPQPLEAMRRAMSSHERLTGGPAIQSTREYFRPHTQNNWVIFRPIAAAVRGVNLSQTCTGGIARRVMAIENSDRVLCQPLCTDSTSLSGVKDILFSVLTLFEIVILFAVGFPEIGCSSTCGRCKDIRHGFLAWNSSDSPIPVIFALAFCAFYYTRRGDNSNFS